MDLIQNVLKPRYVKPPKEDEPFNYATCYLLLGIAIWRQWPLSGLWVIGLFIGIDMLLNGWSLAMLGLAAKNLPTSDRPA